MIISSTTINQSSSTCNGSAAISIQNGKPPYRIELLNQALQYAGNDSSGNFYDLCSGAYLIVVYDNFFCQKTASLTIENITGIEDYKLKNVKLYPNPFKSSLIIELADQLNLSYKVYSLSGALVKEGQLLKNEELINTQGLNSGVYFIDILSNGKHYRQKIIKSN